MDLSINQIALIPIITALVELLKQIGISNKYCPIFSLVFGLLAGVFYVNPDNYKEGVPSGKCGFTTLSLFSRRLPQF